MTLVNDRSTADTGSVPEVLLDATERLFATESPSAVSMRRIADEAGCSLGLAYNYVSSKEELIGLTLVRIGERLSTRVRSQGDARERLIALWEEMRAQPAFHRLMTWLVLEGRDTSELMPRYPMVSDIAAEAAQRGSDDPALAGGMLAFLGISFMGYGGLVNRAMGRAEDDERLGSALIDMFAAWYEAQSSHRG